MNLESSIGPREGNAGGAGQGPLLQILGSGPASLLVSVPDSTLPIPSMQLLYTRHWLIPLQYTPRRNNCNVHG